MSKIKKIMSYYISTGLFNLFAGLYSLVLEIDALGQQEEVVWFAFWAAVNFFVSIYLAKTYERRVSINERRTKRS